MSNFCYVTQLNREVNADLPYDGYIKFVIPANETLVNRTFSLAFNNANTVRIIDGNFVQSDGTTVIGDHVDFNAGAGKNVYVGASGGTVLIPRYDVFQLICASSVYCTDGPVLTDASFIKWNTGLWAIRVMANTDINVNDIVPNTTLTQFNIRNDVSKEITGNLSSFASFTNMERLILFGNNKVTGSLSDIYNLKELTALWIDQTSIITGDITALAEAQVAENSPRTSGTLDIINDSGKFTYNGGVFKRGNIVFSGSGYTINQTS